MHKKIIVHIFTVLLLFTICFSLSIKNTISYSYDLCMPLKEDVKRQELKDMKEKEDMQGTLNSTEEIHTTIGHEEHVKCDPYYHYFWLFFWIIFLGGIVILLFRFIKRKNLNKFFFD